MPAKVVDASVLAAIVSEEPEADDADALINGSDLYCPTLVAFELASVARKKARLQPERLNAIYEALESALEMEIRWQDVNHVNVLKLSLEIGLSTYDASYLHVAQRMGVPLVTFDSRMRRAADDILGSKEAT